MEFKLVGPLHKIELGFLFDLWHLSLNLIRNYISALRTFLGPRGRNCHFVLLGGCCLLFLFQILHKSWTGVVGGAMLLQVVLVLHEITCWKVVLVWVLVDKIALLGSLVCNPRYNIPIKERGLKVDRLIWRLLRNELIIKVPRLLRLDLRYWWDKYLRWILDVIAF